ncbi:MAG: hypothetical protein QGI68_18265 [Pseudomonadales bacterium]|jgi:hypothetical protein|nr:hypothetical protein [Pseudomonadales bacterium]MDP7597490.1 hypothetical protein [Pseudomonadales bacterium]HJN49199.1 hypothetical protein [Pseudomonadales bacterium]
MTDFNVGTEPPREPVGMKIVGVGVILSCLLLSILFGWGIYLHLTAEPCDCTDVLEQQTTGALPDTIPSANRTD